MAAYNSRGRKLFGCHIQVHSPAIAILQDRTAYTRAHKNGWLEQECITPIEARTPVKIIKIEHMITCLATMAYVYAAACTIPVTIFSAGSKFQLVSNFTELHTLTVATRAYVFLVCFFWLTWGVGSCIH